MRGAVRGVRYFLRQYTAMAVKEHIRSQVEVAAKPELTKREVELVRYIRDGRVDWDAYLPDRS